MIETRAVVVQTEGESAVVLASQVSGCEQCNWKGCGTGKLSQLFCSKPRQFHVSNVIKAKVGEQVVVSVADGALIQGVGWVYLLPLLLLIVGAVLGSVRDTSLNQGETYAILGSLIGLGLGFGLAKWASVNDLKSKHQPHISRLWQES